MRGTEDKRTRFLRWSSKPSSTTRFKRGEEGIFSVYVDAPYPNYIHAYAEQELEGRMDIIQDVCNGRSIPWRVLDSNTVQAIASPTEWQNVTSAIKEKGITLDSSVTKVTKRIRCQRMEGADPLNHDLIRIRFGCPGAEAAIAVQWEPIEGDPGLVTSDQVKAAIQSHGIRTIGWDPKWQRVRTPSGGTSLGNRYPCAGRGRSQHSIRHH